MSKFKTFTYTALALIAFAGNSVLCRLALASGAIDAANFTIIRLLSGALALAVILAVSQTRAHTSKPIASKGGWLAAFMLFVYALAFSYAYIWLDTGTGALILFSAVQITMILLGIKAGNRLSGIEWLGIAAAFSGFVYLMIPTLSTPSLAGFLLMSLAGVAWAVYTLKGQGSVNPLSDTTFNFARTLPFLIVVLLFGLQMSSISREGVILAVMSGALTSGVGYAIWYAALKGLTATQAAVVQLLVPAIAAIGGVMFAGEALSTRLVFATMVIMSGISLVIYAKRSA